MSYHLGKLVCGSRQDMPIDEKRFRTIAEHKAKLGHAYDIEERFDILLGNYRELETEIVALAVRYCVHASAEWFEMTEDRRLLDRRIINLLSACRLYLDQLAHSMNGLFGGGSAESIAITQCTNREYDANVSYRLMEAIRNYVQHRGLPCGGYSISRSATELTLDGQIACTVSPRLSKTELVEDPVFKSSVKKEIRFFPEEIDLKPHMRFYVAAITRIHNSVRQILDKHLPAWEETISGAISEFSAQFGIADGKPLGLAIYELPDGATAPATNWHHLFFELIDHRDKLHKRNTTCPNLATQFATGQEIARIKTK